MIKTSNTGYVSLPSSLRARVWRREPPPRIEGVPEPAVKRCCGVQLCVCKPAPHPEWRESGSAFNRGDYSVWSHCGKWSAGKRSAGKRSAGKRSGGSWNTLAMPGGSTQWTMAFPTALAAQLAVDAVMAGEGK